MLIMGILNVTPDSFADGGRHNDFDAAVARGLEMIAEGVDIIDIGGESTRPGADRVTEAEEIERTIPVITELAMHGARISIDTMRASTAEAAVKAGAAIINDVSGGLADPQMLQTAARLQLPMRLEKTLHHCRSRSLQRRGCWPRRGLGAKQQSSLDFQIFDAHERVFEAGRPHRATRRTARRITRSCPG